MTAVNYLWNPLTDNIVREFNDAGNVIAAYTTEPDQHGALITEFRDGPTYQHHYDAQGNTRALTDDNGAVTDTFAYTANGELTERTGNTPTPFQFGGQHGYYADQTIGQVMVRRRDYEAPVGRWLSVDPTGPLDDVDRYRYVRNNPANLVDPSGRFPQEELGHATDCEVKNPCKVTTLERKKGAKCPAGYSPYTFILVTMGTTSTKGNRSRPGE